MRWIRFVPPAFIAPASALALAAGVLVGCDSGPAPKPSSTFPDLPENALQLVGHVHAGTERVAGALVRVDATPGFPVDAQTLAAADNDPRFARSTTTDAAGGYRIQFDPFVYDLSIAHVRDLYVFNGLEARAFDPPLAFEAPVTGFKARVLPSTTPAPRAGDAIAYFVSGTDARTLVPVATAAGALEATFRQFDCTITLHAIEYVAASGPIAAVSEGKLDIRVRDGAVVTPVVTMTPVVAVAAAVFEATPPAGYTLEPLEMEMDLGLRTSAVPLPLTHITLGQILNFGVATDARYFVRARATQGGKGGAVSDSGRYRVDPFAKNALVLPAPVSTEAPIDDSVVPMGEGTAPSPPVLAVGGTLSARLTKGIVEHALVPQNGAGTTFHIATGDRIVALPDATSMGLAPPRGLYVWTVQSFPTLTFTDRLTGEDGRVTPPSWTSAQRVIVIP